MADKPVLYGFNGSTYVRAVRMLLADKAVDYEQVPVNVLTGETHAPEHLARHPFGKVPVLDIDGLRLYETAAILRYIDETRGGPSATPDNPRDRARMTMVCGIVDTYGYGALLGGVAAYHLFPDFVGGKNEAAREKGLSVGKLAMSEAMRLRGDDDFIAGARPSHADLLLAPICAYVAMTPDADAVLGGEASAWWTRVQALPSFVATDPGRG